MQDDVFLNILFELLKAGRTTATELAEKYSLSVRTIYRYVRRLSAVLPLEITRGRSGGILLAERYRLPVNFFTREEHAATVDALTLAYSQTAEPRFLQAKRKLLAVRE